MRPVEVCELCGDQVAAEDAHRAEVSVGDMMCPTPMTFHKDCYAQASEVWTENPDSICVTDPEFPETARWTPRG